jgi:hypothetical protein
MDSHRLAGCLAGLAIGLMSAGTATAQQPQQLAPDPGPAGPVLRPDPAPAAARSSSPAPPAQVSTPARSVTAAPAEPAPRAKRPTSGAQRHAGRKRAIPPARPAARSAARVSAISASSAHMPTTGGGDGGRLVRAIAGAVLLALATAGALTVSRTSSRLRA